MTLEEARHVVNLVAQSYPGGPSVSMSRTIRALCVLVARIDRG